MVRTMNAVSPLREKDRMGHTRVVPLPRIMHLAPYAPPFPSTVTVMVCVGLLTTIGISGTTVLRGWVVVDAELGSGIAGLELVSAPCDSDWVSAPGVPVLGAWDSELAVSVLEASLFGLGCGLGARRKSEHSPRTATLRERQCFRKADRRI